MKTTFYFVLIIFAMQLRVTAQVQASFPRMIKIPAGNYKPFYKRKGENAVKINSFYLDVYAVTNEQFLQFVKANPQWSKSKVSRLFADINYLKQWSGDLSLGADSIRIKNSPVTNVSWFAADAYCKWKGKRLPTQGEWEYVALAERTNKLPGDTTSLTTYVLQWYEKPAQSLLPAIGSTYKNKYGVWDMHGLIWEWVFDFNNVIGGGDSRTNGEPDKNLSCAGGGGSTISKQDYASYMRYAFRRSLKANYTVANLGFRCAKNE